MTEDSKAARSYDYDRHTSDYRLHFEEIAGEMQSKCPIAWTDTYGGHWVAAGHEEVFEIARDADIVSNDQDVHNQRRGYQGFTIPPMPAGGEASFLGMDPPDQRTYRQSINAYLSPKAVERWLPFVREITRAAIDEKIESGRIDFVDDLANIVPAVLTLAMLGLPLADWPIYCEPAHAQVYTQPDSPEMPQLIEMIGEMSGRLLQAVKDVRVNPRPGMINALAQVTLDGRQPSDAEVAANVGLLIGGGFDTTTALTAHTLEYLSENPEDRARLSRERDTLLNSATEEFLRFYTPAPGDGRTVSADFEISGAKLAEGERLWLSWAMANRDPKVFPDPNRVILDRTNNRHASFGLGIHRCIGSNVARMAYKQMLTAALDRMPDYRCDPSGAVHYDTVGVINGMKHLPATFTPGRRLGASLEETLRTLQQACDEQRLAEPVTVRTQAASVGAASE